MKRAISSLALLVGAAAFPGSAQAFSDPYFFGERPEDGGGGGRFFTGSPLDGYSCKVCHRGGVQPIARVLGFPLEYEPGRVYDIEVQWAYPQNKHALNLELVNQAGEDMQVELQDPTDIGPQGRCDLDPNGDVAASIQKWGTRQIVQVANCGSSSVRFRFKAPTTPKLAFSAAIVRIDESEDAEGDGVLELNRVFKRVGSPETVTRSSGSCAVAPASRDSQDGLLVAVTALLGALVRRRRAR